MLLLLLACAAPSIADEVAAPAVASPALYSFADVYRLTVGGAPIGFPRLKPAAEAVPTQMRVAVTEDAALEPRFSVRQVRPEGWLLALAGILLAGWVAHRRLSYL